jgi:N-acetyl-1-D-myo-inositol-2-amino-2-deoxy-alpha-D-glucopyranoside deacetylase
VTAAPSLLCVHAHPDDEVITTGGILARYAGEGARCAVLTCTAGEAGEFRGAVVDPLRTRADLGRVRLAELERACAILGVGPPRLLGYADSGTAGDAPGPPARAASFALADLDEVVGRLVAHVRELRPDVVVTYDAFGLYGHPDHLRAHRATLLAVEASAAAGLYPQAGPAWRVRKVYQATVPRSLLALGLRELAGRGLLDPAGLDLPAIGTPDELITTAVDVRPWLERKWAALRAHASQLGPGSLLHALPEDLRTLVLGTEWFIGRGLLGTTAPAGEDDLLDGLSR